MIVNVSQKQNYVIEWVYKRAVLRTTLSNKKSVQTKNKKKIKKSVPKRFLLQLQQHDMGLIKTK